MPGRLQAEIKQTKPFATLEEEAFLNLWKTIDHLGQAVSQFLRPFGISQTQYNVLRILRGAGHAGLSCSDIGDRMITHDPDITRLLDRLEGRDLISRAREAKDRRVITTRITEAGLALLDELDRPMEDLLQRALGHLGAERLTELIALLEQIRHPAG